MTFFWYPNIDKRRRLVLLFDAAGLGLFAVAGTQKALIAGLNPVMAIFMGVLTGIGGGILRDVLVNQTPTVLQADIYAVAALAAGVVVVIGYVLHYPAFLMMTMGALLCLSAQCVVSRSNRHDEQTPRAVIRWPSAGRVWLYASPCCVE